MGHHSGIFVIACIAMSIVGCVEKAEPIKPVDRQAVQRWVSKAATKPEHPLQVQLGDQVELVGYDLKPDEVRQGSAFTVTWHWKVNKTVGPGWKLFTHLADAAGADRLNQDHVGIVRRAYQPENWLAGEYIRDEQRIAIPADWKSPSATIYVGVWKGNKRLPVRRGDNDGDGRVRALTLKVISDETQEKLPELVANKIEKAPKLDGKLDEDAWTGAKSTPKLVNTMTGAKTDPQAEVRVAWDEVSLYIAFEVADDYLKSGFDNDDDHLWKEDCVEVMVDPDGDGHNYFELQVSPRGKVFDTRYDSRRQPGPFGHVDWNTKLKAGVDARGTLNDAENDSGYTVEMAIPWEAFAAGDKPATRPAPGERWRMNFYVLDARKDGQRGAAWSPPKVGDFHVPSRFGTIRFSDPKAPESPAEPSAKNAAATDPVAAARGSAINAAAKAVAAQKKLLRQRDRATESK